MKIREDKRLWIFERDGNKCCHCGATTWLTIDHIIPKSKGGGNAVKNLQTLCNRCNELKSDTMPTDEYLELNKEKLNIKYVSKASEWDIEVVDKTHWDKIKIPNYGKSDGMVQRESKTFNKFRDKILCELNDNKPNPTIVKKKPTNQYYKYIKKHTYADVWFGLTQKDIGKTFYIDDSRFSNVRKEHFRTIINACKECFVKSTKLQYNLDREHGTPDLNMLQPKFNWSWDSYNKSVEDRANKLREQSITNP